jgi:hypothetical protein
MGDIIVDLDNWAEDEFASLCSRAGVTRNKSIQDRTGWDYIVEFPPTDLSDIPADLRSIESSARVQVKSKRSGKASVTLKLSNALRFAKDPLPCFVVLFLATKGREPVRVFARHFWEQEIGQVLKRGREAHAKGRDDLNKKNVTWSFDEQDEHSKDLMAWMAATSTAHRDRYAAAKADLVRTLGFEDGFIHGNIQFEISDLEALVDHQIGLLPTAPTLNISIKQRRFGIDSATPLFEGIPDVAHLRSHPRSCRVRVRGRIGDDVWLDGQLFLPGLPNLPPELRKCRVVADFIEVVVGGNDEGKVSFRIDRGAHRSLLGLRALVNVISAATEGPLQFQISAEGHLLLGFTTTVPVEPKGEELQQLSNVIACLEKASAGLLPAQLTLSLAEIYTAWNEIVAFNGMVTGTNLRTNFKLSGEPSGTSAVTSLFLYDYVDIGGWTFMAVVLRPILKFEMKGTNGSFECGDPRVVEAIVRLGSGRDHLAELRKLYAQACSSTEPSDLLEIFGGDHRAMMSWTSEDSHSAVGAHSAASSPR